MIFATVALGAFAGGFLRWFFAHIIGGKKATFISNTLACAAAGFILSLNLDTLFSALLITGFCGALSTWSTLAKELGDLIKMRKWIDMALYLSVTIGAGLFALALTL